MHAGPAPRAALFVTCLVDQLFPAVGESAVRLLRHLGVPVTFPGAQTCCGQVAFNMGYGSHARDLARRFLDAFEGSDAVVAPSGSCVSMVRRYYPGLFRDSPGLQARARSIGERTHELSEFLVGVLGVTDVGASLPAPARVTYHDACHTLRELGVSRGPRALIQAVRGAELVEHPSHDLCCGFGGGFSVKYPEISAAILQEKLRGIEASGADLLVATDSSCLMQVSGAMGRQGRRRPEAMHLAQLLARGLGEERGA